MRFFSTLTVSFLLTLSVSAAPVINEVQSTNTDFPDPSGAGITDPAPFPFLYPDWVELHNPTASPVVLDGHYLSDSVSNRTKYQFPAGTTIAPGGFLIVWCATVLDFPDNRTAYHANFGIRSNGEAIVLTAPDGITVVDQFPALPIGTDPAVSGGVAPPGATGRSLGRGTGENFDTLYFYTSPTFNGTNTGTGTEAVPLEPPAFSVPGGLYDSAQTVALSTEVAGGVIRYTLDGSDPTESSPVYAGPLTLTSAGNSSTSYSSIPTNQDALSEYPYYDNWRSPSGPVARMNILRARVFKEGRAPSRVATKSYLVHPLGADRYDMPVVSIVTDPANLFSSATGIYVPGGKSGYDQNFFQSGSAWERFSHLEFFEDDGTLLFGGEIGLRINGNTTRERPRKALRIYNRNTTGSTTWNAQLFPGKDVTAWETFLLRAGGNDWNQSTFRDALVSEIAGPTGLDRQHSRPVAVFLDGEYWGIHNLRDRIDEPWFFHHYGLQESEFTSLEVAAGAPNPLNPTSDFSNPIFDNGDPTLLDDYKDILTRAGNNEYAGAAGYEALAQRIDLDNYIDYNAVTIWSGNTDWPGNNILMWRSVAADTSPDADPRHDGRWRYIVKDNDFALGLNLPYVPGHDDNVSVMAQHNTLAYASSPTETTFANNEIATRLLRKTLENGTFRTNFITRFADLLNTTLSTETTVAKLDEFVAAYGPGMQEHQNRWPTPLDWNDQVARIRAYLQARPAAVRGHIAGKFGLAGTANLTVDVSDTNQGSVTVNTISIDPASAGVSTNPYPWTGTYFQGVPVTLTAMPKPGYRFVSWTDSASESIDGVVSISPNPPVAGQSVTVRYNPAGRPLQNAGQVYLHYAVNSWDNRVVPRPAMSNVDGQWQYTFTLPGNAEVLRMVFVATAEGNDNGPWDNNDGTDWNILVTEAGDSSVAADSTRSYAGWGNGDQGGFGFQPWVLADTASQDDGFFIGNSERAIHASSPDGRSFGIFAHSGGSASATRVFSGGALGTNQTFSAIVSPGSFSGIKGIAVGAAGTNRISFYSGSFNGQARYYFRNQGSVSVITNTFSADTNSTFNFSVTHLGNNVHRVTISRGSTTFTTNVSMAGALDRAVFSNSDSASSEDVNNLYFNNLSITAPGSGGASDEVELFEPTVEVNLTGARTLTASFELLPAVAVRIVTPANPSAGQPLTILVNAVNEDGDPDGNYTGPVTLTISGPDGYSQNFTTDAVAGIATFDNIVLPAGGGYTLGATSGELAAETGTEYAVSDGALFLPLGNGVWNTAGNWDSGVVPDGTTARAIFRGVDVNRDVDVTATTTVSAIILTNGAARNRVRAGNTTSGITFRMEAADLPATIKVAEGEGIGFAGFEFDGNTTFEVSSDLVLDVRNTNSANVEYGGLRFQGNMSGAGRIIKRGPGHAGLTGTGKFLSGDITVEQGVLGFSANGATNLMSTNITVQPGGQLRLSTAQDSAAPRLHPFRATFHLAGEGRAGVPEGENLGVLGALRYEPIEITTPGTTARLTNAIHLTDTADIHVSGATNGLILEGALTAEAEATRLTKSGGGTLTLAAGASSFTGGITVNRGALNLSNAVMSATTNSLVLADETVLTGTGRWGGALQASGGASLSFTLGSAPAQTAPLRVASAVLTGSNLVVLAVAGDTLPGSYPLLAVDGTFSGAGNIALSAPPENYPDATLSFSNGILYAVLPAGDPATQLSIAIGETGGGGTLPDITVSARNASDLVDVVFGGVITLAISGPNNYAQTYTATAVAGVATFSGITVPAGGSYTLTASSGELSTSSGTALDVEEVVRGTFRTMHRWKFNDPATLLVPDNTIGGGSISATPEGSADFLQGTGQDFADAHFRVNNPLNKAVVFVLPTTGYENIIVRYDTRRSGSGAGTQLVSYTLDGTNFTAFTTITVNDAVPQAQELDFTAVAGAADNANFAIKIEFAQGAGGTAGNNRFDNFTAWGTELPTRLHYWAFNDGATLLTPDNTIGGGGISATPEGSADFLQGTGQDFADAHFRVNNPLNKVVVFALPTTGYENIVVRYDTRRSGSGAGTQLVSYTVDGTNFTAFTTITVNDAAPQAQELDFTAVAGAADNANFAIKIEFAQGAGGTAGNNRFDNFAARGTALADRLHYWTFNNSAALLTPDATIGGGGISATPEGSADFLQSTGQDFADAHFRVNNPLNKVVVFALPTTGYENIVVRYDTRRSGSGAGTQLVSYTLDGTNFTAFTAITVDDAAPQAQELDFTAVAGAADNANFAIKIEFAQGAGGTAGNNRFDNFAQSGTALPGITVDPDPDPTAREQWLARYGLPTDGSGDGADTADPDGDGIPNIVERAMFLDPTSADSSVPATLGQPGVDSITFTYRLAKGQDDLTVRAVATASLTSTDPWLPLASTVVENTHPDYTIYSVDLPTAENAGFLRLEVTR